MLTKRTPGAIALAVALAISGLLVFRAVSARPRCWPPSNVPVGFWCWQSSLPSQHDVDQAISTTHAQWLFARAGQLDLNGDRVVRINPAQGTFPRNISIHVVYNASEQFLRSVETVDPVAFAEAVAAAFDDDLDRARRDQATIVGVQLDIDVATRLLPHYGEMLCAAHKALPTDVALSITGLPTWMESADIVRALDEVDFWTPQFYGGSIPEHVADNTPIASTRLVGQDVDRARDLGYPFMAGLAAYGYALHFDRNGRLMELRGDVDPARIARNRRLHPVDVRPFERSEAQAVESRWRCLYQSSADSMIDGLVVRTGEYLLLDVASAEALRASARRVRERAGSGLCGLCVFRLPVDGDPTTLAITEIASALADTDAVVSADVRARVTSSESTGPAITLSVENTGTTAAMPGQDALVVDLRVAQGSVRDARARGFDEIEYLASTSDAEIACSPRRANIIRAHATGWRPGERPSIELRLAEPHPLQVEAELGARLATGETRRLVQSVPIFDP